ncbi:MAG TPA: hypothetical protein VE083_13250 [Terriglobales bacterium]|nr:hypothetical protein [Terriglobales bacterium]
MAAGGRPTDSLGAAMVPQEARTQREHRSPKTSIIQRYARMNVAISIFQELNFHLLILLGL